MAKEDFRKTLGRFYSDELAERLELARTEGCDKIANKIKTLGFDGRFVEDHLKLLLYESAGRRADEFLFGESRLGVFHGAYSPSVSGGLISNILTRPLIESNFSCNCGFVESVLFQEIIQNLSTANFFKEMDQSYEALEILKEVYKETNLFCLYGDTSARQIYSYGQNFRFRDLDHLVEKGLELLSHPGGKIRWK